MRKNKFFFSLLTHIGLIVISIFVLFPFFWMILTSIKDKSEIYTYPVTWITKHATFQNYYDLLNLNFFHFFFNSVFVAGMSMLIIVFLSIIAAYGFSRFKFKFRDSLFSGSMMGQLMPLCVMFLPFFILFNKIGLIDSYASLIILYVAIILPFSIWILTGYFKAISHYLDDAAMIDGCNRIQTLFYILIPPAMPGIVSVALYAFIVAWQEFLFALIFINSIGKRTLPLVIVAFRGQYNINWGLMMAAALITTLPITILFIVLQRKLVSGLTGGAIKG